MVTSSVGIALIKEQEGFKSTLYLDAGRPCIGYGCDLSPLEAEQYKGVTITEQQADQLLRRRLVPVEDCLNGSVKWGLNQNEFDALASLIYNIGIGKVLPPPPVGFLGSTLLKKLNAGDKAGAGAEFPKWRMSQGRVSKPLLARRKVELALFLTPMAGDPQPPVSPMTAA